MSESILHQNKLQTLILAINKFRLIKTNKQIYWPIKAINNQSKET
jgi:hypothetical protein